jgi:hypothetical protein
MGCPGCREDCPRHGEEPVISWNKPDTEAMAMDILIAASSGDPDPVSMFTYVGKNGHDATSVVVMRGEATIEMFRQWAERNAYYNRANGFDGKPRANDAPTVECSLCSARVADTEVCAALTCRACHTSISFEECLAGRTGL